MTQRYRESFALVPINSSDYTALNCNAAYNAGRSRRPYNTLSLVNEFDGANEHVSHSYAKCHRELRTPLLQSRNIVPTILVFDSISLSTLLYSPCRCFFIPSSLFSISLPLYPSQLLRQSSGVPCVQLTPFPDSFPVRQDRDRRSRYEIAHRTRRDAKNRFRPRDEQTRN